MLTLNQIVSQITNLAAAHNQIAESGVGDFAEWQAKERSYPILWVFHESTSVNQMEIAFSIRLICADRVIVGEEGDNTEGHEQEVLSDTLLVLLDFLAYFQQNHSQPYNVVTSATIDPFTERLNDRLAGNSVTIQIRQPFDWNKCQIPQSGASIPPSVDGLTLYNFCDPSVVARLTDAQRVCLEDALCETPPTLCQQLAAIAPENVVASVFDCLTQAAQEELLESECVIPPCAPATFSIDGTQVDTIASGADLDVTLLLDGVAPPSYTYNAGTDTLNVISPPSAASTTALLMKTGQTVSYQSGDDGDFEAGRETSFLVLSENNPFGNTNRFTDLVGGQTYAANIVIDWATYEKSTGKVLMWERTRQGIVNWTTAVTNSRALSYNGWTNWRLPNVTEGLSLFNYGVLSNPLNYSPFTTNALDGYYWTGTTNPSNTVTALLMGMAVWASVVSTKTNAVRWIAVRTGNISELVIP